MSFSNMTTEKFTEKLASKEAVPGGGGASALAGAVGAALGCMVANLTVGKKKYAAVEQELIRAGAEAERLRMEMLRLIDDDAQAFAPLSAAYSLPKDDPNSAKIMENALKSACAPPLDIMRAACRAIELMEVFAEKGSTLVVSDAGVGAVCCKAALQGAALNVFINTGAMSDRAHARELDGQAEDMLSEYAARAGRIYESVSNTLKNKE